MLAWTDLPDLTLHHLCFPEHQQTVGAVTRTGSAALKARTPLGEEQFREDQSQIREEMRVRLGLIKYLPRQQRWANSQEKGKPAKELVIWAPNRTREASETSQNHSAQEIRVPDLEIIRT